MTRPPKPANEVQSAVAKAYASTATSRSWKPGPIRPGGRVPRPITSIEFDAAKLAGVSQRITHPANWRHWLWEHSPKRPEAMLPLGFLKHLYQPGENVLLFDCMESKEPLAPVTVSDPMDCRGDPYIREGGTGVGIWFLCNPVDGEWHPTGEFYRNGKPKLSCRNAASITAFRYAVFESDEANARDWFAFLAQLPMPITAIYTSGSRSIHALVRVDAQSKAHWDEIMMPRKRQLRVLGCDSAALSAVRLTRLPGCRRPEKQGFQRLLYLNPNPTGAPLLDMPIIETRQAALARWRELCPRWNPERTAFL